MSARKLVVLASITSIAAISITGGALAAAPVGGATYKGAFTSGPPSASALSFKVSANGKEVSDFTLAEFPIGCQGGAFGNPEPADAVVSKTGTFSASLTLYFAPRKSVNGKVVVTGSFLKGGREHGMIRTVFTNALYPKTCDKTTSYSTTG